ncbi:hypothetical protein AB0C28_52440 [Nonomuraea sp. NPDC048892]|uniref:hypothetical protein n=1 Tax=Nonomuraea sp. NPDC048892 TaxID=3154624 RepID=UPI00340429FA
MACTIEAVRREERLSADDRMPGFPIPNSSGPDVAQAFIRMDDPEHIRLRGMLTGEFTVKQMERLRSPIQEQVDAADDPQALRTALTATIPMGRMGRPRRSPQPRDPRPARRPVRRHPAVEAAVGAGREIHGGVLACRGAFRSGGGRGTAVQQRCPTAAPSGSGLCRAAAVVYMRVRNHGRDGS